MAGRAVTYRNWSLIKISSLFIIKTFNYAESLAYK